MIIVMLEIRLVCWGNHRRQDLALINEVSDGKILSQKDEVFDKVFIENEVYCKLTFTLVLS